MKRLLALSAVIALLVACGEEPASADCAGYTLAEGQTTNEEELPVGRVFDVNGDDLPDTIVELLEDGSEIYLNCGDGRLADILRSGASLVPVRTGEAWQSFELSYDGDRSVIIDDMIYRFDMLPLTLAEFREPRIVFDGKTYKADFPLCTGLNIRAPLYSGITPDGDVEAELADMSVEFGGKTHMIRMDEQDEYGIGSITPLDVNDDDTDDVIVMYEDSHGSGRDRYGAVMLGCGDGRYIVSGQMQFGAAGGERAVPTKAGHGLLVEQQVRPPFDDPLAETAPRFAGYSIDPETLGLEKIADSEDRAEVTKALSNPAQ